MITAFHCILFVDDPARSSQFYRDVLALEPSLEVPGMTEFPLTTTTRLGLMPRSGAQRLLGAEHANGDGIRGETYLYVDDPALYAGRALKAGGKLVSKLAARNWGDEAVYVTDPDGHLLVFARCLNLGLEGS